MFDWLKKHFLPHEGNEYRPHLLRSDIARNFIVIILFLELSAFVVPSILNLNLSGGMAAVISSILGELTNSKRQEINLPTLVVNPLLTRAAEMKAQDMAEKSYFAHVSPEGKTPWYWIELAGYKYKYAGENLAVNFRDSEDVTAAWLASPTHRANIVKGKYTEMGTGIAHGVYNGRNTVFVAQVYASPLPVNVAVIQPAPVSVVSAGENVLGAEMVVTAIKNIKTPSPWQRLLASPRHTTNFLMIIIFGIVALALLLYLVFRMRHHEQDLVTNGLAVLAIVLAVMIGNYYWSFNQMEITQSYDYALEDTI